MATKHDVAAKVLWIMMICYVRESTAEQFCPLDSYDCSQAGVTCTILRDPDCSLAANISGPAKHYPGPVTDLSISPYYLPPDNAINSISRVEITWGLPQNNTYKYLSAVEVRLNWRENVHYCFIFDMKVADITDDVSQHFALNCSEIQSDGYSVNVTSLPDAPYSDMKATAMLNIIHKHRDKPAYADGCRDSYKGLCWDTDIVVYNEVCTETVRVVFTQAPEGYGIEYYQIALLDHRNYTIAHANVSRIQDPGSPILEGTISASTIPRPLNNGSVRVIPKGTVCWWNNCRDSASHPFNIWPATSEECTFLATPASETSGAVVGIIVAVVAAVAALVTVIIIVLARSGTTPCHKASVSAATPSREPDMDSISSFGSMRTLIRASRTSGGSSGGLSKKIVYLVYSDDHPAHTNAVNCLDQLIRYQNYQTIFFGTHADIGDLAAWVKQSMQICDHILLINSEGAFRKTRRFSQSHYDGVSCLGDMFTATLALLAGELKHLTPKLVMCYFEYTSVDFIRIPLFDGQANYCLTAEMDDLFRRIDSSTNSTNDFVPDCELSSGQHFLDNAIQQATRYIRNNPDWCPLHTVGMNALYPALPSDRGYTAPQCHHFREPVIPDDITFDGSALEGFVSDINQYG